MKYFVRMNMSCFLTIFLSCIQRATRIRCGDGPVVVPASSKITQPLLFILSGWMGTRSFERFFRKKPTASSNAPLLDVASWLRSLDLDQYQDAFGRTRLPSAS